MEAGSEETSGSVPTAIRRIRSFRADGQQGISPNGLLTLYKGLFKWKILYVIPFVTVQQPQLDAFERFHQVALRLCLGLPPYSKDVEALMEAQEQPISLPAVRAAMHSFT